MDVASLDGVSPPVPVSNQVLQGRPGALSRPALSGWVFYLLLVGRKPHSSLLALA